MNNSFFTITLSELSTLAKKCLDLNIKSNTPKSNKNSNKQKKRPDKQKQAETQQAKQKNVRKEIKSTNTNTNQVNTVSNLIDIDKDNLSKYILYTEILGAPVCKRNSGRY